MLVPAAFTVATIFCSAETSVACNWVDRLAASAAVWLAASGPGPVRATLGGERAAVGIVGAWNVKPGSVPAMVEESSGGES